MPVNFEVVAALVVIHLFRLLSSPYTTDIISLNHNIIAFIVCLFLHCECIPLFASMDGSVPVPRDTAMHYLYIYTILVMLAPRSS